MSAPLDHRLIEEQARVIFQRTFFFKPHYTNMRAQFITAVCTLVLFSSTAFAGQSPVIPPILFENHGQAAPEARFVYWGDGFQAYYHSSDILLRTGIASLHIGFVGASPSVKPSPLDSAGAHINFLKGADPARWSINVPIYSGLVYRGLYPGINLRWRFHDNTAESEFVLAPHADVKAIRVCYSGTTVSVRVDSSGALLIATQDGIIREHTPVAYMTRGDSRIPVRARFVLKQSGEVGFDVGPYDHNLALVLDPVLSYSSYLGGTAHNSATSVAVDASGGIYVAGWTESLDFPVTGGLRRGSGVDAFVAKFTSTNTLAYCTYIGGGGDDRAMGIAVDGSGNAVIAGITTSPDMPFTNALQAAIRGPRNAFIAKLNSSGTALLFGTYLGGSVADDAAAVALDSAGNIYVAGATSSTDFPVVNAFQPSKSGQQDGYVLKLDATGRTILYSTFLGGSNLDTVAAIAVDSAGSAYVVGNTFSSNFPVTGAIRASIPGQQSAFVTKFSPNGKTLAYSTFLGGSGGTAFTPEAATGIAVDVLGAAYVTGVTSSTDFPIVNPYQSASYGGTHGFVSKLNSSGNALVFSTYFGGSGRDWPTGIAVDTVGSMYICGYTSSDDFPAVDALQSSNAGIYDAFVARLTVGGSLVYSTYLGGASIDSADAIAVTASGRISIVGHTMSSNFPTVSPFQSVNSSAYAAFLAIISEPANCSYTVSPGSLSVSFSATNSTATLTGPSGCLWTAASNVAWITITSGQTGMGAGTVSFSIAVNSAAVSRTGTLTVTGNTITVNQHGQAARGDFDGNGTPDIVLQSTDTVRQVALWYMGGQQGSQILGFAWIRSDGMPGWTVSTIADMNGDGVPDVIIQNDTTRQIAVYYMGGAGGTAITGFGWIRSDGTPGWSVKGAADFNGDGVPDLIIQNDTTKQIAVYYMGGAGGTTITGFGWIRSDGTPGWSVKGAADFNGDGVPDVIIQNDTTRQIAIYYMGGAGGTAITGFGWIRSDGIPGWSVAGLADLNGDGVPDVIIQNDSTRQVAIYYMGGQQGSQIQGFGWISSAGTPGWTVLSAH